MNDELVVCAGLTDSYGGAYILPNWSLIYKLIASMSYLIVWYKHNESGTFYFSKQLNYADYKWFLMVFCFFFCSH